MSTCAACCVGARPITRAPGLACRHARAIAATVRVLPGPGGADHHLCAPVADVISRYAAAAWSRCSPDPVAVVTSAATSWSELSLELSLICAEKLSRSLRREPRHLRAAVRALWR